MSEIHFPRIETKRLILEAFKESDVEDIFDYASNPEVTRFLSWPAHRNLEDSKNFLDWVGQNINFNRDKVFFVFAIRLKSSNRVIGSIDFKKPQPFIGQLDYALHRNHWGQSYMPEAGLGILQWARSAFPEVVRFSSFCEADNKASARVMEKIGMQFEGIRRKSFRIQGRIIDLAHYALIVE